MPQLSAVIITKNEADNISRALSSLKGITDDIVVIDSGSVDSTVEICLGFGARVYTRTWEGYSSAKNYGNSIALNPWILSIDADESVSDELRSSILKNIPHDLPVERVYSMNRITNYCGKWIRHSGWYPDTKIRIWHRDFGHWQGDIHEVLRFSGSPEKIHLKGDLLHYSFPTRDDYLTQRENFTNLAANSLFQQGKKAGILKLWLSPAIRFIRDFVFNMGFLDGKAGLEVCRGTAHGVFMKYKKLRKLYSTDHQ